MVVHPSSKDEIWSSKMINAARNLAKNVFIFAGHLAAVVTGVDVRAWGVVVVAIVYTTVAECATEIKGRIRCFDLRTQWYSYQSNRLINR